MRAIISYAWAISLGLLIVAPPIGYDIPVWVNSFHWLYAVVASAFFGIFLILHKFPVHLKALLVYLFIACFFSQAPYLSFNAFMILVVCLLLFKAALSAEMKPIFLAVEAAFWVQFILIVFQVLGMDVLLNFNRPEPVFLGTVMQYMRLSSAIACMVPFLILRNKAYIIPVAILCVLSQSMSFLLSLVVGVVVYLWFREKAWRKAIVLGSLLCVAGYAAYDWGSIEGAFVLRHGGRVYSWMWVVATWLMDTSHSQAGVMTGPFNLSWFLFGHGMDTFLALFPVYKQDLNPFPQAHNDWLQILWETGIVGFALVVGYISILLRRLFLRQNWVMLGGSALILTNMFCAFPMRMTQTALLLLVYLAYCEQRTMEI